MMYKYNIFVLGASFFFLYLAYQTVQNFLTSLFPHELGFISLSTNYASSLLFVPFAPYIVKKLQPKRSMLLGALGYILYTTCLLFYQYWKQSWIVYLGSIIFGFSCNLLWIGQGVVINLCTTDTTRGQSIGLFWAMFMFAAPIGNILGFIILSGPDANGQQEMFFWGALAVSIIGFFIMMMLKENIPTVKSLTLNILPTNNRLWTKEHFLTLILIFFTGFELSFTVGYLPVLVAPADTQESTVGLVFSVWGLVEAIGAPISGRLADRMGHKSAMMVSTFIFLLSLFMLAYINDTDIPVFPNNKHGVSILAYISVAFVAFSDTMYNVVAYSVLGKLYPGQLAIPAFATFQFSMALGASTMFLLPIAIESTTVLLVIQAVCAVFATLCMFWVNTDTKGYELLHN